MQTVEKLPETNGRNIATGRPKRFLRQTVETFAEKNDRKLPFTDGTNIAISKLL